MQTDCKYIFSKILKKNVLKIITVLVVTSMYVHI